MPEEDAGCVSASEGPVGTDKVQSSGATEHPQKTEETTVLARVGAAAPDFEATALVDGSFKNVRLSDYRGHWVALCFYPGDFTFV